MALKSGIFTLVIGALLLGSTARAQDAQQNQMDAAPSNEMQAQGWQGGGHEPYRWDDDDHDHDRGHKRRGIIEVHVHTERCNHGPQPTPPRYEQGRYELQLVQKWFPGRYEQVWVEKQCKYKPRRNVTVCKDGYYEQRWVPGRYETVEEWVWVPAPTYRRGHHWSSPATHWN